PSPPPRSTPANCPAPTPTPPPLPPPPPTHPTPPLGPPPASVFNHALDRLTTTDRITLHDGLLHPFSRHQFDLRRELAARPKLPVRFTQLLEQNQELGR